MMFGFVWKASYRRLFVFLLMGAVAFRIATALYTSGDTELTVWGDRDLWRALTESWPVLGPEINGGLRPPGGAFYLLLAGILAIHPSVLAANIALLLLFAAALLLLGCIIGQEINPLAGALAAAALAGCPMLAQVLKVWNPGFLLLFATAATLFGYRYIKTGRPLALALAAAAIAVGLQIHLQIFQVVIGLAIAMLIRRPRWTRAHSLALVLGMGLPFLPTLLGGNSHLLASASPVTSSAVENYVLWGFNTQEKSQLIYGLFGGSVEPMTQDFSGLSIPAMVGDFLAALLAFGFCAQAINSIRYSRIKGSGLFTSDAKPPTYVFPLITGVFLFVGLVSTVNERHLVAVWPAVAIMTGIAADSVLRRFATNRHSRLFAVGGAILLSGLTLRPLALGALSLRTVDVSPASVAVQSEIAATVKTNFYATLDAFDANAALFWKPKNRPWQLVQEGVEGQMSFVFRTTQADMVKTDQKHCLAILNKQDLSGDPRADLSKSPAFAGLTPVFGPAPAESRNFAYFPYKTSDGNCLKSFPNAYIPTAFEVAFLQPGTAASVQQSADSAQFIIPLPGEVFPIGLEFHRSDGAYQAVLHGRLLRGYTGLHFASIINPTLCLVGDAGVWVVSVGRTTVGSPQRGTLAPWQSSAFALAEGSYQLWLTGRDVKSPHIIQMPLGTIDVPTLHVAPPLPGSSTPPTGCPVLVPPPSGSAR
jgi:hypothetical protein